MLAKGGCGLAVLIVCAAVMVGGVFYSTCMYNTSGAGAGGADASPVIMHVAGNPIRGDLFDRQLQSQIEQSGMGSTSPDVLAMTISRMLDEFQTEGAKSKAVEMTGINTDDAALTAAATQRLDNEIDQARQQLISQKKLAPTASQADFDKALKAQYGKTSAEIRAAQMKQVKDDLGDSDRRKGLILSLAQDLLTSAAKAKHNPTDAEVRASYDKYIFQQLRFLPAPPSKGTMDARIKAAQDDIKKGVPFDKVVDTYSTFPMPGGKKASENTIPYTVREMTTNPSLKALAGLKVGEVSPVLDAPGGKAIFKLVSISSNLPKDYDKNREKYRKEYADQLASQDVDEELKRAKATAGLVTFDSPAYLALHDAFQAGAGMMAQMSQIPPSPDKLKKAEDEAIAAGKNSDSRIAALARYEAESALWNAAPDKPKMRAERIDTLLATLQHFEDFDLRMELVDDYLAEKKNSEAANQLLTAAQNNSNYTDVGIGHFTTVRDKLQQMQKGKSVDDATAKQIEDAQLKWSLARADYDKDQQDMKKAQAEEKAKLQADEAKEMAKARADAAKKAKTPIPVLPAKGSTPSIVSPKSTAGTATGPKIGTGSVPVTPGGAPKKP